MAVDGSTSTSWMSSTTSGEQWVRVDLGTSQSISNVKVFWPATYFAKAFRIETSTDGASWTQRYSSSTGTGSATNAVVHSTITRSPSRFTFTVAGWATWFVFSWK